MEISTDKPITMMDRLALSIQHGRSRTQLHFPVITNISLPRESSADHNDSTVSSARLMQIVNAVGTAHEDSTGIQI